MSSMDRREFIRQSAAWLGSAVGAQVLRASTTAPASTTRPTSRPLLQASDVVELGKTGIKPSRLAMGTGTKAGTEQQAVGIQGMVRLFRHACDQGVRWWDSADMYKAHPYIQAALKELKRDTITITTKTMTKDAAGVRGDIERFRKEMNTDYIDVVLLHCLQDPRWPEKMKGVMDVLSEAKQKGLVRAVGCSCHTLVALQAAAGEPWVDVVLARINPFAAKMDVKKVSDVPRVLDVLRTMHQRGKGVCGMKILGEGTLKDGQIDQSLRFVLGKRFVSGFTIGFSRPTQVDDIIRRIEQNQPE